MKNVNKSYFIFFIYKLFKQYLSSVHWAHSLFLEKILARQSEKLILAEGVIGADAGGFKDLSREELLDLFTLDGEA